MDLKTRVWGGEKASLFPMTDTDIVTQNLMSVRFSYKTTAHILSSLREQGDFFFLMRAGK